MSSSDRILLADDNLNDIELTKAAFEDAHITNGIDAVRDGEEALDYLFYRGQYKDREQANPMAIFLDLKMPKVDGHEVLEVIKKDEKLRFIPCVIMTSSNEERDRYRSYQNGANAYVVKPIDFDKFQETVRTLGMFWAVVNRRP